MAVYAKEYGYFFDSNAGDRTYSASSFEEWLRPFFTTGVFNGELAVTAQADPDMTVSVATGHANINGKPGFWDSSSTIQVAMASGVYNRIDTIVLRRDNINRRLSLEIVTGVASDNPQPTPPTRTNDIYELVIAQIRVRKGTTSILASDITDKRMDSSVCGWVVATVTEIDFDQIREQFDGWVEDSQALFMDWFDRMKGQLSEDAAGHLQQEIDETNENIGDLSDLPTTDKSSTVAAISELNENKVDKVTGKGLVKPVVNSLTSTDADAPLSAAMGKQLDKNKVGQIPLGDGTQSYETILQNAFSSLPDSTIINGKINSATVRYYFEGLRNGDYGTFLLHSYDGGPIAHGINQNGSWYWRKLVTESSIANIVANGIRYIHGGYDFDGSLDESPTNMLKHCLQTFTQTDATKIIDIIAFKYGQHHIQGYLYAGNQYGYLVHTIFISTKMTIMQLNAGAQTFKEIGV